MAFLTLSSTQLFHAYNVKSNFSIFNKKTYKNKFMNFAFLIGFVLQVFVIYCPGVNTLFGLQSLDIISLLISLGLALSIVVIFEVLIPITSPAILKSGPPLFPGLIAASI